MCKCPLGGPDVYIETDPDIVGFASGTSQADMNHAVQVNFNNYVNAGDAQSTRFRAAFYAVMLHGWGNSVSYGNSSDGWSDREFAARVNKYWRSYGKGRAIILLSCFTGAAIARVVARQVNTSVVAPGDSCRVEAGGKMLVSQDTDATRNPPGQGYVLGDRYAWYLFKGAGKVENLGGPYLNRDKAIQMAGA
jgi:hypothetical protein